LLLKHNTKLLIFPDSWQARCKYFCHGHGLITDEYSCAEAQKTAPDDLFPKPFVKMLAAWEKAAAT